MNRTTDIIIINSVEKIPALDTIRSIPREQTLKLIFEKEVQNLREATGQQLRTNLKGFYVGIHTLEPEIRIAKLITDLEIEENQDFFEQCAKDYRALGEELIDMLVDKLDLKLNKDFPLETFNQLIREQKGNGTIGDWEYNIHGFHCSFDNTKTHQSIEVPLVFGQEFGDLDPYFFSLYIKSTDKYKPLPVDIFEDYADGLRINEKMLALGKFERIISNLGGHFGTVVTDRKKVKIKSNLELEKMYQK